MKETKNNSDILKLVPFAYVKGKIIFDENNNPIDYIFLDVNKAFEEMTGLKAKDIINKKVTEILPDIRKGDFDWINFYGNVAIKQTEETFEQYSLPLNKWYKGHAFSTEKGYFTVTFTDITNEYKMADYAKELNEYNYENIDYNKIADNAREISGADYAILNIFDDNGKDFYTKAISGISKIYEKITNILGFSLVNKKWEYDPIREEKIKDKKTTVFDSLSQLLKIDIPKIQLKAIEKTFNLGNVVIVKTTKDNKMVGVFNLIFKKNNKLKNKSFIETYADLVGMTINRINTEKELKKSEKNIRTIAENSPDIVARFDKNLRHIYINPTIEKYTGVSRETYIGKTNEELGMPEQQIKLWNEKLNYVFTKKQKTEMFFDFITPEGEKYYHSIIVPEYNNQNEVTTLLSITRDITNQKNIEKELIITKSIAEKANKSKSLFLSKITHDLKTPLNGISGFTKLIKEQIEDEKILNQLNYIDYSTNQMENLINNLLDISKVENKSLILNKESFYLKEKIEKLINSISLLFKQKDNKILLSIHNNIPEKLIGDKYRLNRIIQNLLTNANKFTDKGEIKIIINLEKETTDNYTIKFIVSDTGMGIEKEKLDKLFTPYYQAHDFDGKGTGLGLALCKELVELMNGEINIESEEGKGTTVIFTAVFEKTKGV